MTKKYLSVLEIIMIIAVGIFPLFLVLPNRGFNYLSWEGAYRLSKGQIPFRDFGSPVGGAYWVIPALFFKIFGCQVITLLKTQAFLNIVSGLAFRSILKTVGVTPLARVSAVFVYCISYSFQNYWPWYNHSVFVYGFVALAFVIKLVVSDENKHIWWLLIAAGFFTYFSFFTKQDGGGLIFLICVAILLYNTYVEKKWLPVLIYLGSFLFFVAVTVLYFSQYEFGYWFNYGQKPHGSRIMAGEIINGFLGESQWLKFYLLIIVLLMLTRFKKGNDILKNKKYMTFLLLTLGILGSAAIVQITSYVPTFVNMYFHSFAFAFILNELMVHLNIKTSPKVFLPLVLGGTMLWWSELPWDYFQRLFISKKAKGMIELSPEGENMVGINNYKLSKTDKNDSESKWATTSSIYTLKNLRMPAATIKGIERILDMDIVKEKKDLRVLNISELTFLAAEIPYELERNPKAPLWHHLGVGMFNEQLHMYEQRIHEGYYDLVIFEYIPTLNNYFPFGVRDALLSDYKRVDSFLAPKSGETGSVEVYIKKD
ncbi:MAG: hypothetical protein M9933_17240 [Chitinophagaceae bacterium]|nr:hypothetical protein [Chitinophagaceae bacterium]